MHCKAEKKLQCLLLWIFTIFYTHATGPQCGLCETHDVNCDSLVRNASCTMKYFSRNSAECANIQLQGHKGNDLGQIHLNAYLEKFQRFTLLNISFSNIKWTSMTFRIQSCSLPEQNTCRKFILTPHDGHMIIPSNLFYDCRWGDETIENKKHIFEYSASNGTYTEYRKIVFKIPHHGNLISSKFFEMLLYYELVDNKLSLHWSGMPSLKYRVNVTSWVVTYKSECSPYNTDSSVLDSKEVVIDNLTYDVETEHCYSFTVEPFLEATGTWGTGSQAAINFTQSDHSSKNLFVLAFVLVITLSCLAVSVICIFRIQKELQNRTSVLLIYSPSSCYHMKVIHELASFLKKIHGIKSVSYIDQEEPKVPTEWLFDKFRTVDLVLIVSSPNVQRCCSTSVYYCETFAENLILDARRNKETKTRQLRLLLPYCGVRDFPKSSDLIPRINLQKFFYFSLYKNITNYSPIASLYCSLFKRTDELALEKVLENYTALCSSQNAVISAEHVSSESLTDSTSEFERELRASIFRAEQCHPSSDEESSESENSSSY